MLCVVGFAALIVINSIVAASAQSSSAGDDDVGLAGVRSIVVTRMKTDKLDVIVDVRNRTSPPCSRLGDVRVTADGARVAGVDGGGTGWITRVSDGFSLPLPERACKPAKVRIRDVDKAAVRITLAEDGAPPWTIALQVPPEPSSCRWVSPEDGRLVPGQRARIACDLDDLATIEPRVQLFPGDNRWTAARPVFEVKGGEITFAVPVDWQRRDGRARVEISFTATAPKVTSTNAPVPVTTQNHAGRMPLQALPIR